MKQNQGTRDKFNSKVYDSDHFNVNICIIYRGLFIDIKSVITLIKS